MHILFLLPLLGGLFNAVGSMNVDKPATGLLKRTVNVGKDAYSYQIYVPANLEGQKNLPVLILLHGIGQRGEGGFVLSQGPTAVMAKPYLEQMPAIVLLPQCRPGRYWHNPDMEQMVMAQLDSVVAEFGADTKRL